MKQLMLIRHAHSAIASPGESDFERPLDKAGKEEAFQLSEYIFSHKIIPDIVLCSAALRASQTFRIIQQNFPLYTALYFPEELYHCSQETLVKIIKKLDNSYQRVLILAHNPGLEDLSHWLLKPMDNPLTQGLRAGFPSSTFLRFMIEVDHWKDLESEKGMLKDLYIP